MIEPTKARLAESIERGVRHQRIHRLLIAGHALRIGIIARLYLQHTLAPRRSSPHSPPWAASDLELRSCATSRSSRNEHLLPLQLSVASCSITLELVWPRTCLALKHATPAVHSHHSKRTQPHRPSSRPKNPNIYRKNHSATQRAADCYSRGNAKKSIKHKSAFVTRLPAPQKCRAMQHARRARTADHARW